MHSHSPQKTKAIVRRAICLKKSPNPPSQQPSQDGSSQGERAGSAPCNLSPSTGAEDWLQAAVAVHSMGRWWKALLPATSCREIMIRRVLAMIRAASALRKS